MKPAVSKDIVRDLRVLSNITNEYRIKAVLVPLCAADEIERLRTIADELAAAIEEWNVFADEHWPSLMCRPGTSALRNYKEQR